MLYIGQSGNIQQRWRGHHLRPEFRRGASLLIAWHETFSEAGRMKLETMLIRRFRPRLNSPPKPLKLDKVGITLEVPRQLRDDARRASATTGIPVAFILRQALEAWVKEQQKGAKKGR